MNEQNRTDPRSNNIITNDETQRCVSTSTTMSIIFLLIGISLLVALTFLAAFLWAVRSGQYEDDYTPAVRMLFDDEIEQEPASPPATRP